MKTARRIRSVRVLPGDVNRAARRLQARRSGADTLTAESRAARKIHSLCYGCSGRPYAGCACCRAEHDQGDGRR